MTAPAAPRSRSPFVRFAFAAAACLALAGTAPAAPPDGPAAAPGAAAGTATGPKVVVVGFDGLAADRVETLMAAGKLPALAKLRERGGYTRLVPSNPAQSPVSWASVTTGWNPGKTGIYDFLRRRDLDPERIEIGLAEKRDVEPISWWLRVGLLCGAGLLGAITGGALVFAGRTLRPGRLRGKSMEIGLTLGAAVFASGAFVVLRWVPERVPTAVNLRSGEPFWVTLDRAGVPTVTLEAPLCFPPEEMGCGSCLAGLGVPDMAGSWGSFSVWSDDPSLPAKTETAGSTFWVAPAADRFDVVIAGPPNALLSDATRSRIREEANREQNLRAVALDWDRARRRESETREALVRLGSSLTATLPCTIRRGEGATVRLQDGAEVALAPGKWSDLLPVAFVMSPVTTLHGRVRLLLEDAGGGGKPFRLFTGQVQWDLQHVPPNVRLTSPASFAAELGAAGPTETIGWPEMTNPVKDRLLSDRAFLDHTYAVMALRERRFYDRIAKDDWRCLFAMFSEPDRVQHALFRHADPENPLHDAEQAKTFSGEIDRIYVEADRIVGETVRRAGPDAIVLVVSDHGFAPFRRGVNLNNFLRAKGWQTGSGAAGPRGVGELTGGSRFFDDVDWRRTKAYAMGLGNVYVNVAGREPEGAVPADQVDAVVDAIAKDLEALTDAGGKKVVRRVYRGRDLYSGARAGEAPDLVVGFEWGYRVSWQTCLGGLDADVITDNTQPWSGDHCSVDPELVPAVLFSSIPLRDGVRPSAVDVAPSVLSLFGVAPVSPDGTSALR